MITKNGKIKKTRTPIKLGARKAAETSLAFRNSFLPRLLNVSSTRGFLIFGFFSFLLKAVENAIKTKKPLTDEDYDKIFSEPYDLVIGKNKKLDNFGKKKGEKNDARKRD